MEDLRRQSQRRNVQCFESELILRADAEAGDSPTGNSGALPIVYRQSRPDFRAWQNSVRQLRLVLKSRPQTGKLVVSEIQKIEIEIVPLGDGRVLDPHWEARVQVPI
jgi:hypothetical protein